VASGNEEDIVLIFKDSSFKHGVSKEDIGFAFATVLYDALMEGEENKYLRLGFDGSGNLLEIIYNIVDDHTVNVFHAKKCRKMFLNLITE